MSSIKTYFTSIEEVALKYSDPKRKYFYFVIVPAFSLMIMVVLTIPKPLGWYIYNILYFFLFFGFLSCVLFRVKRSAFKILEKLRALKTR
ncbi:hypothetical protein IWQ52_004957 [Labrenzia sp. EL_159]|nr:hypothetical protein [Labrenzia sp. EL_162]MBG6160709.1 hypothetical protein [Labrenzia sp. EL_195]MBG6197410.1 hypothetical protein [Labrenzia sp. EL_159]